MLKRFPPDTLADLRQGDTFSIVEAEACVEMRLQNPVLGGEVFILQEEFLIDQTGHVCQQPYPFVVVHRERSSYRSACSQRVRVL